jgi:hypothetical protein
LAGLVPLAACANLGGLFAARTADRGRGVGHPNCHWRQDYGIPVFCEHCKIRTDLKKLSCKPEGSNRPRKSNGTLDKVRHDPVLALRFGKHCHSSPGLHSAGRLCIPCPARRMFPHGNPISVKRTLKRPRGPLESVSRFGVCREIRSGSRHACTLSKTYPSKGLPGCTFPAGYEPTCLSRSQPRRCAAESREPDFLPQTVRAAQVVRRTACDREHQFGIGVDSAATRKFKAGGINGEFPHERLKVNERHGQPGGLGMSPEPRQQMPERFEGLRSGQIRSHFSRNRLPGPGRAMGPA